MTKTILQFRIDSVRRQFEGLYYYVTHNQTDFKQTFNSINTQNKHAKAINYFNSC